MQQCTHTRRILCGCLKNPATPPGRSGATLAPAQETGMSTLHTITPIMWKRFLHTSRTELTICYMQGLTVLKEAVSAGFSTSSAVEACSARHCILGPSMDPCIGWGLMQLQPMSSRYRDQDQSHKPAVAYPIDSETASSCICHQPFAIKVCPTRAHHMPSCELSRQCTHHRSHSSLC